MKVIKIVLTGGPCAGKTTIFEEMKKHFSKKGIKVIALAESATELITSGIRPWEAKSVFNFQNLIYSWQKFKEQKADESLNINNGEDICVILYDRGIIDNKAYLESQKEFDYLLAKYRDNEINLLDSYDYVIDLISLAVCKRDLYSLESNEARFESVLDAVRVDRKTSTAWIGHRNMKVFKSDVSLEQEVASVLAYADQIVDGLVEKRVRRFLIENDPNSFSKYTDDNSKFIHVKDIHLIEKDKSEEDIDYIITKRSYKNSCSYTFSKKIKCGNVTKTLYDRQISCEERLNLLMNYGVLEVEERDELTFMEEKEIVKVLFNDDSTILEVEEDFLARDLHIPEGIKVIKEIDNEDSKDLQVKKFVKS